MPETKDASKQEPEPLPKVLLVKKLNSSLELKKQEVTVNLRKEPGKVIMIAGPVGSGKTGLITGLFLRLKRQPFKQLHFAGSETLLGWKQRVEGLCIGSGNSKGKLKRSRVTSEIDYLHLKVQNEKTGDVTNLFLTDIQGEFCNSARKSTEEARLLFGGLAPDHFLYTIDGEKMLDGISKNSEVVNATEMFNRLVDGDILGKQSHCSIVLTKADVILSKDGGDKILSSGIELIESKFKKLAGKVFSLNVFSIAACPDEMKYYDGFEFEKLIRNCIENSRPVFFAAENGPDLKESERQIDQFKR